MPFVDLRHQANEEDNVTREDIKWLLVKFTIPVDLDDRETFADTFDPERTNKINYKDLLYKIDPENFDWKKYAALLPPHLQKQEPESP